MQTSVTFSLAAKAFVFIARPFTDLIGTRRTKFNPSRRGRCRHSRHSASPHHLLNRGALLRRHVLHLFLHLLLRGAHLRARATHLLLQLIQLCLVYFRVGFSYRD